ncbi:MAG: HAMP domain-containing histidine kinase [Actinobacteria bacterium]|nr:HAMP domain-containing histidine kinase [Actinomycetota bacterium]MBU1943676.1 HAMP domain-containing histidine kinase [Actinomycetota bacterium]MBU2686180.1 HAMP domain-containing histidine kinase [Actinomycetota bacterium]
MKDNKQLRFYRWLLLGIFLTVEAYVLGLNLYYLIAEDDTWTSFAFNFASSTVLTAFVIGLAYCFLWRTVTSLQESEARYKELSEDLKRSNAELAVYAHTVSHDLKGPIASVATSLHAIKEMLKRPTADSLETARELSDIALRSALRGNDLVDELLTFAEADQPKQLEDVDVSAQVAEVLRDIREEIESKDIRLEVDDDLGRVRATDLEIYQVFSNLIMNAIVYGGPRIEVRMVSSDGENTYLVRDNGPGIPEDLLQEIFEPFVKGADGRTGIGLAIVRKIVDAYGSGIRACNDDGACFEFSLRRAR